MNKNCIEELPKNNNFRSVHFNYNEKKYEMNVSLYSNAIIIFISYNGKISNLYELNIDPSEEQENYFINEDDDNIKDVDITQCILGKRGNEEINFIANFIISSIKDIVININFKITKICLSLSIDNKLINDIKDNSKIRNFLDEIKINIGKLFNTSK